MESGSTMDYLADFIRGWEGVQQFEDATYLDLVKHVTPSSSESVAQAVPSGDLLNLEDFLNTAEKLTPLMPYKPSSEEELLINTLDDKNIMDFLVNRGQGTKGFASEPNESNLYPSPKKENASDCQLTDNQGACAAPPASATDSAATRRRKTDDTEDKPYIKKPPNAFMLFRAEQRQNVVDELNITDSAKVNMVLGQRWKMLLEQEKAPYFEQAHRERRAHEAKYPGWSYKDNFGKKAKRRKSHNIPVPPSHHLFAFPVAPANQQPVMTWPYATAPMSFPNQAVKIITLSLQKHSI